MSLPKNVRDQYLARFDELISEGKKLSDSIAVIPPHSTGSFYITYTTYNWDPQRLARWKTNCLTLFQPFAKHNSRVKEQVDVFFQSGGKKPEVEYCLGILDAFRDDFERGFLDDLLLRVEAEVAGDYMGQAEELLNEGKRGAFDHVPAAVLAGAVLEKALRTLCGQQQPPLPINTAKGEPKTMNPLIDDLKSAGQFNELKAKQLRSWADIRNKAAHGEFDQFKRTDVEQMIEGINNFLGDYLG
jgi:hypothetical protein